MLGAAGRLVAFVSLTSLAAAPARGEEPVKPSTAPAAAAPTAGSPAEPPSTRSIMQSIFEPMSRLLGISFDAEAFEGSAHRAEITREIDQLVRHVDQLEAHAKGQDRAFEFVAKSLAVDAHSVQRRFAKGHYDEARFILHNMTDNCIACHSSLPETRRFPGADQFFAKVQTQRLDALERAHFEIVTRRFDDALATYETFFRSKELDPALITMLGAFSDYLKVAIDAKGDFKRPQTLLAYFIDRPATPLHVKRQLEQWLAALKELDAANPLATPDLATARRIMGQGRQLMEFERDREGLVHYLTAEGVLTRYIRSHPDRGADVGEAYYLLGIAASMSEHSFWLVRSDFYLESAIRLAPGAAFAPKAYSRLEESLVAAYSGSGGTHVPDDVKALLAELKRIHEQAQGKI
jgi:hypothetical protein